MRKSQSSLPPEDRQWRHWSEGVAASHLESLGLQLLASNWHSRRGELDLIMREQNTIVFVEVRQRSGSQFGSPAESVRPAKIGRMRHTARLYLLQEFGSTELECRFDVVLVTGGRESFRLEHLVAVA